MLLLRCFPFTFAYIGSRWSTEFAPCSPPITEQDLTGGVLVVSHMPQLTDTDTNKNKNKNTHRRRKSEIRRGERSASLLSCFALPFPPTPHFLFLDMEQKRDSIVCPKERMMAITADEPCWADMVPDALARIFSRLCLEDILGNIALVCRSWRRASQDAMCWRRERIDLDHWSCGRKQETLRRILVLLVNGSRGCLREICAPSLIDDDLLRAIAWSGSSIQVLRIPYSLVTEDCLCQLAPKFAAVTFLDVSGCDLSRASLEFFGKHCPRIMRLNLNMYPPSRNTSSSSDDVALVVAQHMPQLRHLEMAYGCLSNIGLRALLEKCTKLEHLDLRGCWQLNMEESIVKDARQRLRVFHTPAVGEDIYNTDDSDLDASDYYDESDFYDEEMWYDSEMEDEFDDDLVMEMHEEEINGTLYFWPEG